MLTGQDLTEMASAFLIVIKQPKQHYSLAVGKARYVGEPVAVVVATDRYIAEDALDLIDVEYRVLEVVVDPQAATVSGAPVLYEEVGDNVVSTREFSYGDPDKAFAEADKIGRRIPNLELPWSSVHTLITDERLSDEARTSILARGVKLICVAIEPHLET